MDPDLKFDCGDIVHAPRGCEKVYNHTMRLSGENEAGFQAGPKMAGESRERRFNGGQWGMSRGSVPTLGLGLLHFELAAGEGALGFLTSRSDAEQGEEEWRP